MALIKERTKKRKGENVIGKIIYGFLVFAPLLLIGCTSLYVIQNENAYQSYSGSKEAKYEQEQIENITQFKTNEDYLFDDYNTTIDSNTNLGAWAFRMNLTNVKIENTTTALNLPEDTIIQFSLYYNTSNNGHPQFQFTFVNESEEQVTQSFNQEQRIRFTFTYLSDNLNTNWAQYDLFYKINWNNNASLDNSFEYGCYKAENSTLFNWAKNTGTYQVLETTTTQIGITNTFIPFLMAYWLLISVIYFIFDIALILIWMVHDKIHELKDSI